MHESKALMAHLSDAFIPPPGGIRTVEEITEIITLLQLGYHQKRYGILNIAGYFDTPISFLDQMVVKGFSTIKSRNLILIESNIDNLLSKMSINN